MTSAALPPEDRESRPAKFWPHDLVFALTPFLLVLQALIWFFYLPLGLRGVADFRSYYTGAYMIRTGHGGELYDFETQMRYHRQLLPDAAAKSSVTMNHPAFEELIFLPLSLLPYRAAFWIFFAVNLGLLAVSLRLLWPYLSRMTERWSWFPVLVCAEFFPLSRTILQGQDSILLLALLCAAFVLLEREQPMAAGLLVGCGVFRYQITIPIAVLYLLWRRWKFVVGFTVSTVLAVCVSILMVGIHGAMAYAKYTHAVSVGMATEGDMMRYNISPLTMLNLRGLISEILWGRATHFWTQALIFAASALVILVASRLKPSLPNAIIAASLVSYHFLAHDASIWIIPIFAALCGTSVSAALLGVGMLIGPFAAINLAEGIHSHAYLGAVPLLGLFLLKLATGQDADFGCGQVPELKSFVPVPTPSGKP
jgi:hypothetical protein